MNLEQKRQIANAAHIIAQVIIDMGSTGTTRGMQPLRFASGHLDKAIRQKTEEPINEER